MTAAWRAARLRSSAGCAARDMTRTASSVQASLAFKEAPRSRASFHPGRAGARWRPPFRRARRAAGLARRVLPGGPSLPRREHALGHAVPSDDGRAVRRLLADRALCRRRDARPSCAKAPRRPISPLCCWPTAEWTRSGRTAIAVPYLAATPQDRRGRTSPWSGALPSSVLVVDRLTGPPAFANGS